MNNIQHPFPPLYDAESEILILGSFPSVRSREQKFFYGHPQNRFWRVTAAVFGAEIPVTIEEKRRFLLAHHIALWDVIASCEITGSADSSIRNVRPNDLAPILRTGQIRAIYTNGAKAAELYRKHLLPASGIEAVYLPSTSPANAACTLEELIEAWRVLRGENIC